MMNKQIALLGVIEMLSSITCGILILFLTYRMIKIFGIKKLGIEHSNTAYNIFTASVLFAVGYVMSGVIQPILDSFRLLSYANHSTGSLVMQFLFYGGTYIAIGFVSTIIICLTGIAIYTYMTPMNEIKELKNNNIGIGVIIGTIIIVMALLSRSGIILIIESMVPYNDLPPGTPGY